MFRRSATRGAIAFRLALWALVMMCVFGYPIALATEEHPADAPNTNEPSDETAVDERLALNPPTHPEPLNPFLLGEDHAKEDVGTLYAKAVELIRGDDWNAALNALGALRQSPRMDDWNYRSHLLMAYAYLQQNNPEAALEHLKPTPTAFGGISLDLRFMLGETYRKTGDWHNAYVQYRAISQTIERREGMERLAVLEWPYSALAQWREIEMLIKLERHQAALARSFEYRKKYKDDALLLDPSANDPEHPYAGEMIWLSARAYRALGKGEDERRVLKLVRLEYPDCRCYDELMTRMNELAEAGAFLDPPYGEDLVAYADRLRMIWQHEAARDVLNRALASVSDKDEAFDPQVDEELRYIKGRVLDALQDYEGAIELLEPLALGKDIRLEEKRMDYLSAYARSLSRLNRLEEAAEIYARMAAKDPASYRSQTAAFLSAWLLGHKPEAYLVAQKKLADFIDSTRFRELKHKAVWFSGWFAYRHEDDSLAKQRFTELLTGYRWNIYESAATYWLGQLFARRGEFGKAKSCWVVLAGRGDYNYYRLLAGQRLQQLMIPDPSHPVPHDLKPPLLDIVDAKAVGIEEIDGLRSKREAAWKNEFESESDAPDYDPERLEEAMQMWEREHCDFAKPKLGKVRRELYRFSRENRSAFPDLRRFVNFDAMGMRREASEALGRFLEQALSAPKRASAGCPANWSEGLCERERLRHDALDKAPDDLMSHLLYMFYEYGDGARAFRTYQRGLDGKARAHLPESIRKRAMYPFAYGDLVKKNADDNDVPEDLVYAVMRTESFFRPWALSNVNAGGLMQVMPHTGRRIAERLGDKGYSRSRLFEPEMNVAYGTWYLKQLLIKFNDQLPLAIASYNGGPHNVVTWMERNPDLEWDAFIESIEFAQTRGYVKKVLRVMATYRLLHTGRFSAFNLMQPIDYAYKDNINW